MFLFYHYICDIRGEILYLTDKAINILPKKISLVVLSHSLKLKIGEEEEEGKGEEEEKEDVRVH